jgi:hypothetical protein
MVPTRRSNRCEFCKRLRSARKQPDQNEVGLQNRVRDINGLAQNPIGYRYTIPMAAPISCNF